MNWEELATTLIKPFEGLHRQVGGLIHPYLDKLAKPPVWTRGFGRCYGIDEHSPAITPSEAELELRQGVRAYGLKVLALAPALASRPRALAACTSWAWNCGIGAFKVSRLRRAINEGRWQDAAELISKPDTAGGVVYRGLQKRRLAEKLMFKSQA